MGRTAKPDGKVLLTSQQQNNVGFANLGGRSIQAALKKSENVWVIIRNQTARLLFRQHRHACGFDETLEGITRKSIAGRAPRNDQGFFCMPQERDRTLYAFRIGK